MKMLIIITILLILATTALLTQIPRQIPRDILTQAFYCVVLPSIIVITVLVLVPRRT